MYCRPARKASEPEIEEKRAFVAQLGNLLAKHKVKGIIGCQYKIIGSDEVAVVHFEDGAIKVNISGDSCLAIMHDIYRALV